MKKYDNTMMSVAYTWAKESYAKRLQVGAVISKKGRILITGYNGTVTGSDNKCELTCPECNGTGVTDSHFGSVMSERYNEKSTSKKCTRCQGKGEITSDFVIHAEQNTLMFAAKEGIKVKGCTMYITHAPCKTCSKLIAQVGIKKVVYSEEYRDLEGVEFLKDLGIKVKKLKNKG